MVKDFPRLCLLVIALSLVSFSGCSTVPKEEQSKEKVSTIPWNAPQDWEHKVPMGGATY